MTTTYHPENALPAAYSIKLDNGTLVYIIQNHVTREWGLVVYDSKGKLDFAHNGFSTMLRALKRVNQIIGSKE